MLKKILVMSGRVLAGIILVYLLLGFAAVPLGIKWAIKNKGTALLNHPVQVRSVRFNPLSFRLSVYGLAILDSAKQTLAGFDKFWIDISFVKLLKKEYRVESVGVDGLKVNVVLLPQGRINILDLLPAQKTQPGRPAVAKTQEDIALSHTEKSLLPEQVSDPSPALPLVIIDTFAIQNGTVNFVDQSITPNFFAKLHAIDLRITDLSTKRDGQAKVAFNARIDDDGRLAGEALVKPLAESLACDLTFSLNNYALPVVTPYSGKYAGRAVADGRFDLKMDYRIVGNKLTASHKLLVQHFGFGNKLESKDALNLPFGLAVALLEDPQGRITIALPVTGDMSDPEFHYTHLIGQVIRNFFVKLVTKPFAFIGSLLGSDSGTEDLGYARFSPGNSDLSEAEKEKLQTLIDGLAQRPKLVLEIDGGYDPEVDWKAIKTDRLTHDFEALKRESTRSENWVYQELYQRRFGIRALWAIVKKYKISDGVYDNPNLNDEIRRRIIEDAPADKAALEVLAVARANAVYGFMVAAGFDSARISLGPVRVTQSSMGLVPLEFTLTGVEPQS